MLSQQLDESDNEAVLQELQQLEDQQLQEELKHMPAVPKTEQQQEQQPAAAAAAAEAAGAEAAVQLEEELPSVPKTKVGDACYVVCYTGNSCSCDYPVRHKWLWHAHATAVIRGLGATPIVLGVGEVQQQQQQLG